VVSPEGRVFGRPGNRQALTSFLHHSDWQPARLDLLATEKEFTRQRDALTRRRMAMSWERGNNLGQACLSLLTLL